MSGVDIEKPIWRFRMARSVSLRTPPIFPAQLSMRNLTSLQGAFFPIMSERRTEAEGRRIVKSRRRVSPPSYPPSRPALRLEHQDQDGQQHNEHDDRDNRTCTPHTQTTAILSQQPSRLPRLPSPCLLPSSSSGLTIILCRLGKPIQSPPRPPQVPTRPIKRHISLVEQALVDLELVADLEREVMLTANGGREEGEASVLVYAAGRVGGGESGDEREVSGEHKGGGRGRGGRGRPTVHHLPLLEQHLAIIAVGLVRGRREVGAGFVTVRLRG